MPQPLFEFAEFPVIVAKFPASLVDVTRIPGVRMLSSDPFLLGGGRDRQALVAGD